MLTTILLLLSHVLLFSMYIFGVPPMANVILLCIAKQWFVLMSLKLKTDCDALMLKLNKLVKMCHRPCLLGINFLNQWKQQTCTRAFAYSPLGLMVRIMKLCFNDACMDWFKFHWPYMKTQHHHGNEIAIPTQDMAEVNVIFKQWNELQNCGKQNGLHVEFW